MPHQTDASGEEDAPMTAQSNQPALTAQQLLDWDEFEERFLEEYRENMKREDAAAEEEYQIRKADLTVQLAQWQREKAASEKRLRAADARIVQLQEGLRSLEDEFQVQALNKRVSRNRASFDLKERFRKSRQSGPLDMNIVRQIRRVGPSMTTFPPRDAGEDADGHQEGVASSTESVNDATETDGNGVGAPGPRSTGVTICRSDGTPIGHVDKLTVEPRVAKSSVKVLLNMPIKRNVIVREGRRFGPAEIESIHQSNDGRFSKWFSCMIQAVGTERPTPCDICSRNAGPFVSCVRVDDTSPRCGNCEWSRRGCNDADSSGTDRRSATVSDADGNDASMVSQRPSRKSQAAKADGANSRDATLVDNVANTSGRKSIAPAPSESAAAADAQPSGSAETLDFDVEQLRSPTITLRHDGKVYTHPELMAGVPVEKIDKDHPYWEPNWKDPVDLIRTTLAGHEEKYNQFVQDPKDKPHHKYFHGRQVNRGRESLEFLQEGSIHPFQLVGKKWMSPAITTYDTLHRLANTLKELAKFGITVSPVDWLRQRLCEIVEAQGESFSLSNTVKDLYHDPKVQALRHASGYGNVGRPVKGTPRAPGARRKRKRKGGEGESPAKRVKEGPAEGTAEDELGYDGYTDTEEECGVALGDNDFRLRALRTRRYTTAEAITQYWHLSPHAVLDLQLLQSVDPPEWTTGSAVDGQPVEEFSLAMDDVAEVTYHPESLFVKADLKNGEGVMVSFWRERTKRRFLALWKGRRDEIRKAES